MKNLIVSLALVLTTGSTPLLAHGINNDPRAEKVFTRQFAGAENVKWTTLDEGYEKVVFTLNGVRAEAYYSVDAELLGTVRNLSLNQLPLLVIQTLGNKFADAAIIEVKEITNSDGTQYKVLLEQKEKKYNLRFNSLGNILEKEKIKK